MTALPASLAPAEGMARAVYETGWRPPTAEGPTRDELVALAEEARARLARAPQPFATWPGLAERARSRPRCHDRYLRGRRRGRCSVDRELRAVRQGGRGLHGTSRRGPRRRRGTTPPPARDGSPATSSAIWSSGCRRRASCSARSASRPVRSRRSTTTRRGRGPSCETRSRALSTTPPSRAASRTAARPGGCRFEAAVDMTCTPDVLIHTWDLARATGLDERLDADEVHRQVVGIESLPAEVDEAMRGSGHFGPRVEVPPDADEQSRLLAFMGRTALSDPARIVQVHLRSRCPLRSIRHRGVRAADDRRAERADRCGAVGVAVLRVRGPHPRRAIRLRSTALRPRDIRRVSFIRVAKEVGLSLDEIGIALCVRCPTTARRTSTTGSDCQRDGARGSITRSVCSSGCATGSRAASAAAVCRSRRASWSTPATKRPHAARARGTSSTPSDGCASWPSWAQRDGVSRATQAMSLDRSPEARSPSRRARSAVSRLSPSAATFSSRYFRRFVPGMGTTSSPWA